MISIGFKITQGALEACKRQIEVTLSRVVADVTSKTYNYILEHEYPYWSGQYIASWDASIGNKTYAYQASVGYSDSNAGAAAHYPRPNKVSLIPASSPYAVGYITNSAPHAYKVEHDGTPTHPNGGWYIALAARNNTVGSYKFF